MMGDVIPPQTPQPKLSTPQSLGGNFSEVDSAWTFDSQTPPPPGGKAPTMTAFKYPDIITYDLGWNGYAMTFAFPDTDAGRTALASYMAALYADLVPTMDPFDPEFWSFGPDENNYWEVHGCQNQSGHEMNGHGYWRMHILSIGTGKIGTQVVTWDSSTAVAPDPASYPSPTSMMDQLEGQISYSE